MKIPSLSADSTADYKAAQCLNYDSVISRNIGDKSSALLSYAAASSIQQSVEAEMLAAQLIDDIQVRNTLQSLALL